MLRHGRIGALGLAAALAAALQAFGSAPKTIHKTVPLASDGRVVVDTYKGSVHVTTWDRSEVDIDARIEADGAWTGEDTIQRADVRIDASNLSVRIKSDNGRGDWGIHFGLSDSPPAFHYRIRMPRKARLEIKDYKSRIEVDDLHAELRISTYRGDTSVTRQDGPLHWNSHRGEIRAGFVRVGNGTVFDTYRGEVEIAVPGNEGFRLAADVGRHGQVRSDFPEVGRRASGHVDWTVNGGGPQIQLKGYRGSFRLRRG